MRNEHDLNPAQDEQIQSPRGAEENKARLQAELKEFVDGATMHSAKLLAIHYRRQILKAEIELMNIYEAPRRWVMLRLDKDAASRVDERIRRIKEDEIPLQEVMIDGFDEEYPRLTPITTNLEDAYYETEQGDKATKHLAAKIRLLEDLDNYRKAGIKRPAK